MDNIPNLANGQPLPVFTTLNSAQRKKRGEKADLAELRQC